MNWELLLLCKFLQRSGELLNKNVYVITVMFLMSGNLTGLCLYMSKKSFDKNIEPENNYMFTLIIIHIHLMLPNAEQKQLS